ncbi:MAG TPA: hypothetical protein VN830_00645 [Verrucomicrobiae bacterium]|nr:hypothetical protein [Verrucomicrobiae bacterium]
MRTHHARPFFLSLLVSSLLFAACCFAQAPLEPAQLPAQTTFYLLWRGTPSGDVRKSNALLSLWDDPDSASMRSALVESLLSGSQKQKDTSKLSPAELAQYASLLDNPFVLGYLPHPDSTSPAKPAKSDSTKLAPAWNGLFFVYDRSGKEELLTKTILRLRAADPEIPKLTPLSVAGVSALKIERKAGVNYLAETGKFAVSASELPVFEEILNRLAGKGDSPSLAQSAAYQEAKPLLGAGIFEFFLHIPEIKNFAPGTDASAPQVRALLNGLKLDSVHVLAGHLSLEGGRTRLQGAVLGDTTAGSLFDIWPEGQANPVSLSFLTPDTVTINAAQINFLGIYETLKRAISQAGPDAAKSIAPVELMIQTRLGMPLTDALALTTGEIASIQSSPTLDDTKQIFLFGIRNKPEAMKLLRTIFSDQITSERNEGSVTYMKISLHGGESSAGLAQWNFYYLAMTPDLLLGASKSDTLRAALARQDASASSSIPQSFLAARKEFPEKLNGFTYYDMQKLDWPALKEKWIAEANKSSKTKATNNTLVLPKQTGWLDSVNPAVFSRHLHSVIGASWKDAKGVHFDEWLD